MNRRISSSISHLPSWLLLLLLVEVCVVDASFTPFMGCKDNWAWGNLAKGDCYSVDMYVCHFRFPSGCQEVDAYYSYYIGGETEVGDGPFPLTSYSNVTITASTGCVDTANPTGGNECSVTVNGQLCAGCTNTNDPDTFRSVTMTDCGNLAATAGNIFALKTQTIAVTDKSGDYLELAYDQEKCDNPAVQGNYVKKFVLYPQMAIATASPPTDDEINALVENTNKFLSKLIQDTYGAETFRQVQINRWSSSATNTNFNLLLTTTVLLDPASTATPESVAALLETEATSTQYLVAVKPSGGPFATSTSATISLL